MSGSVESFHSRNEIEHLPRDGTLSYCGPHCPVASVNPFRTYVMRSDI